RSRLKLWENYNGRTAIIFSSLLAAFFVTYFVQDIFSFDNIGTYILFFLVAGFIQASFSLPKESAHQKIQTNPDLQRAPASLSAIILGYSAVLVIVIIFYQVNIKPAYAAMNFTNYIVYENTDVQKAFAGYQAALGSHTLYDKDLTMFFIDRS